MVSGGRQTSDSVAPAVSADWSGTEVGLEQKLGADWSVQRILIACFVHM